VGQALSPGIAACPASSTTKENEFKKRVIAALFSMLPAFAATPAETAIRKAQEEVAKRPDCSPS
jgi:hypothetical protein